MEARRSVAGERLSPLSGLTRRPTPLGSSAPADESDDADGSCVSWPAAAAAATAANDLALRAERAEPSDDCERSSSSSPASAFTIVDARRTRSLPIPLGSGSVSCDERASKVAWPARSTDATSFLFAAGPTTPSIRSENSAGRGSNRCPALYTEHVSVIGRSHVAPDVAAPSPATARTVPPAACFRPDFHESVAVGASGPAGCSSPVPQHSSTRSAVNAYRSRCLRRCIACLSDGLSDGIAANRSSSPRSRARGRRGGGRRGAERGVHLYEGDCSDLARPAAQFCDVFQPGAALLRQAKPPAALLRLLALLLLALRTSTFTVTELRADDPDESELAFAEGDTLSIRFSAPTGAAPGDGLDREAIHELVAFSSEVSGDYWAYWNTSQLLVPTFGLVDAASAPPVGAWRVECVAAACAAAPSPPLAGAWGYTRRRRWRSTRSSPPTPTTPTSPSRRATR